MAFVCGVIFSLTDEGSRLKVSSSISAKTGIAFHHKIDVADAHIVHGLTITSSPGSTPAAPIAVMRAEVAELTVTACFTLKRRSSVRSNSCTFSPP